MTWAKLDELLRRSYVQTAIMVVVIVVCVVAFWYGLRFVFRTESPLLAVASGSMEPVLYEGDLILIQGMPDVSEIVAAPKDAEPAGDIIVFRRPYSSHDLIVHRAIEKRNENGDYIFKTQGDANSAPDSWEVKETDIVGEYTGVKVPLLGHIALFFEPFEVKVAFILLWIVLLVILEFVPLSSKKEEEQAQTKPL